MSEEKSLPERGTPHTPASQAAEKSAQPSARSTAPAGKGHPGGLISHCIDLAKALRDRRWADAATYFVEIVDLIREDLSHTPPAPAMSASLSAASADQVAERLETFAADLKGSTSAGGDLKGAIPWAELFLLLRLALDVILSRRT